ncbi:YHS domain-containing (seleno)protein [Rhodovulum sp. DZ06]|uniref:YHS domain-containing (seleno)protein n=1 Tax=Rhodovulum sp. DZ06 TaxID=3425126 RepID=UPI003D34AC56
MKTALILPALGFALLAAGYITPAFAADEVNVSLGTTVEGRHVALRGYDAVALSTGKGRVDGRAAYTHVHEGVAYYFETEASQAAFAADPDRYLPRFGGFCTLGVALGKKLDAAPRWADIVDGKLYVFLNEAVYRMYEEDKVGWIAKAYKAWDGLKALPVAEANS